MGDRKRETVKEREREREREKQMCQNCVPTMNVNTLCKVYFCNILWYKTFSYLILDVSKLLPLPMLPL